MCGASPVTSNRQNETGILIKINNTQSMLTQKLINGKIGDDDRPNYGIEKWLTNGGANVCPKVRIYSFSGGEKLALELLWPSFSAVAYVKYGT